MGSELPAKFHVAGYGNGAYQAGLFAARFPDKVEKLLLLAPSRFCPEAPKSNNIYTSDSAVHLFNYTQGMTKQ